MVTLCLGQPLVALLIGILNYLYNINVYFINHTLLKLGTIGVMVRLYKLRYNSYQNGNSASLYPCNTY